MRNLLCLRLACLGVASLFVFAGGPAGAQTGLLERSAIGVATERACDHCLAGSIERRVLAADVAEYRFDVRVGPGANDVIGLHRVVREKAPFVPRRTVDAVFMVHGDIWPFAPAFLAGVGSGADVLPVHLAARGIDVWGIDLRWTRVPAATTDLSFMSGWGFATDVHDLGVGLAVARLTRALTGQGLGKLHLLGWSRGGQIGYAYLDGETQLPAALRQVKGFVPVDIYLKTDVPGLREAACIRAAQSQALLDSGEVADATGQLVTAIGGLALAAPADASPVLPGLSNRQAGLLVGAATFALFPPGLEPAPFYHFTGGTFDGNGIPDGLSFTAEPRLFELLAGGSSWQPIRQLAEADAATCDGPEAPDVPWDDHLGEIEVPVLYLGAGGGFGDLGVYTTTLLGSQDVTSVLGSVVPPAARIADLGHADIFNAADAPAVFWQPLLDWLLAH